MYVCAGNDLHLNWEYITLLGESVYVVEFTYSGITNELIGVSTLGNFLTAPAYDKRVESTTNAGVTLKNVSSQDAGSYVVEIMWINQENCEHVERRVVNVVVASKNVIRNRICN